jgi:hypothetical protein
MWRLEEVIIVSQCNMNTHTLMLHRKELELEKVLVVIQNNLFYWIYTFQETFLIS